MVLSYQKKFTQLMKHILGSIVVRILGGIAVIFPDSVMNGVLGSIIVSILDIVYWWYSD